MRHEEAEDIEGEGALGMKEVLASVLRVVCAFDSVLGRPERAPEEMEDHEIECYQEALTAVWHFAEEKGEGAEFKVDELAELANKAFQKHAGVDPIMAFESIAPELREKWRHLVKHIWNMIAYDSDEGTVESHEERMTAIFRAKLEAEGSHAQ